MSLPAIALLHSQNLWFARSRLVKNAYPISSCLSCCRSAHLLSKVMLGLSIRSMSWTKLSAFSWTNTSAAVAVAAAVALRLGLGCACASALPS